MCHCFDDTFGMTTSAGKCMDVCTGNGVQACGGKDGTNGDSYNIVNISMYFWHFEMLFTANCRRQSNKLAFVRQFYENIAKNGIKISRTQVQNSF